MDLTCPKCHGTMRTYERSGITVDQCTECRGIFLDRGELERLVDAETAYHAPVAAAPAPSGPPPAYGYPEDKRRYDDDRRRYEDERRYDDRRKYDDDDRRRHGEYHHKKRKKSLFEELFD
jgi:Zn-finger nucleic acid-binding protein